MPLLNGPIVGIMPFVNGNTVSQFKLAKVKGIFMAFYYYAILAVFMMLMPCLFFVNGIINYNRNSN
ncbi:hypothetical protein [Moritella viscosa]|uniref:Pilot protein MxiM n=1 Tax=Moritella viscosa TaxID=80854 RepID=A0ABY1HMP6_9GAMM|nr:hypothetical protein [Moritella viscosa]SGZ04148.1 Pilot protein MxiM [Moritella viscosa]SGZ07265.1 Pilot protein MxiM [Moritella viscosa]SGZ18595.1 Pilot protein MxiM [Moritella viscosa]SHN99187.1 Pilot protein MxiM [Moritella viscosa]SHO20078.1 Pilot protein MxiM [Moritella viscosa]